MAEKKQEKKRLVLLDAHAILHRSFHAMPEFSSSKGEPTGALYGFAVMVMKIIREFHPEYLVACFDRPEETFRKTSFAEYKAGRPKTAPELIVQLDRARDLARALGITVFEQPGFEADDLLGTIVEQTRDDKDLEIIIATGDMDSLQLVEGDRVRVYTLRKGIQDTIIYNEEAVRARFGFRSELLPDYKGLRGDPSDNIPGIKGIGEVSGGKLIREFGSIEDIYKTLEKKGEKPFLDAGFKQGLIEKIKNGHEEALFSKVLGTIRRDVPIQFNLAQTRWRVNGNNQSAKEFFKTLEFKSLSPRLDEAFSVAKHDKEKTNEDSIDSETPKLEMGTYDPEVAERAAIALFVLDSSKTNASPSEILEATGEKTLESALANLEKRIDEEDLGKIYRDIELPLIPILRTAEARGILVDKPYLEKTATEFKKTLASLESRIYESADLVFNINSPKQLGDVLFTRLALGGSKQKKTPTGALSTKHGELEKLRDKHPIIPLILEYREIMKLLGTYAEPIVSLLDKNNRLHTRFVQHGAETGRFASLDPNLQNIPIRTENGMKVRRAFIADKGYSLVSFDYSQIELRVLAALSRDKKLLEIFHSDGDIHTAVASEVFGVAPDKVDKEMRRRAKVINFGIIYGMGVNALKASLGTSQTEARAYLDNYFKMFAGVREYLDRVMAEVREKGYTETFFGRRRTFIGIKSSIPYLRASAERQAMNAPIQGTAADIIKIAMKKVDDRLRVEKLTPHTHLLLQIHDELLYEIEEKYIPQSTVVIREEMERVFADQVPVVVNVKTGTRWGEL